VCLDVGAHEVDFGISLHLKIGRGAVLRTAPLEQTMQDPLRGNASSPAPGERVSIMARQHSERKQRSKQEQHARPPAGNRFEQEERSRHADLGLAPGQDQDRDEEIDEEIDFGEESPAEPSRTGGHRTNRKQ